MAMNKNRKLPTVILLCLLLALPLRAHAAITPDDIAVFSREGVQVIFPGETSRHTFAEDISPDKLLTAEMIDFSGVTIGDKPEFFAWLTQFDNLRKLALRNTSIHATPELLRAFIGMEKLQKLDLSENPLFEGDAYSSTQWGSLWGNLSSLNELALTDTNGTVENYGSLVLLKNLHTLHLGNNPQLCARSLLGRLASWSSGSCVKALELNKLPLVVLDLSNTGLTDDPLPDLPVATLRELSFENNALNTLTARDLPQLEYWNLAGNADVELSSEFGSVLNLKALRTLLHDPSASIPSRLQQRFASKTAQQDTPVAQPSTAITITPPPAKPSPTPLLQPKTSEEIQSWLAGADQTKHQAALNYLKAEAKTGDKGALHWLGQAYHKGWGLTRNWITARNYYWQAFNSGDSTAKNSIDAIDREAANAITEWRNSGKSTEKGQLAHDLYTALAKTGNKNAQGWLDWLAQKRQ